MSVLTPFPWNLRPPDTISTEHLAEGVLSARDAAHLEILELGRDPQDAFHRTKDRVDRPIARGGVAERFSSHCSSSVAVGMAPVPADVWKLTRLHFSFVAPNRFSIKATISAS